MDGFSKLPKMQCFKDGGSVLKDVDTKKNPGLAKLPTALRNKMGYKKEGGAVDMAQDKKVIKKAFAMHDKQEHEGEKTDLSKLKKGGRAKKECGTVKKYKCGGGVYGAKKGANDIKSIEDAKDCKPKMLCGGKSVRKMSDGGGVFETLKNNVMGTPEQNAQAKIDNDKYIKAKMAQKAAGQKLGGAEEMALKIGQMGQKTSGMMGKKRGGKACK